MFFLKVVHGLFCVDVGNLPLVAEVTFSHFIDSQGCRIIQKGGR